jgi:hypothetical protein
MLRQHRAPKQGFEKADGHCHPRSQFMRRPNDAGRAPNRRAPGAEAR